MEPFNAGWLSLLHPAAAIVAELISREVISALLVGIFTGAVIYTSSTGGGVIIGSLDAVFSMMVSTLEFKILIFTSLLGAVVYLVSLSGGSKAYGGMGRTANEDQAEVFAFGLRAWLSCVY